MARDGRIRLLAAALVAAPLLLGVAPPGQLAQAVEVQRGRVAEEPGNAGLLNDLGNLLVESGELAEAEEIYRRAMELEPGRPEPPYNLALLLAAENHPREARRLLTALLKEHPDHAWGHYQLGALQQARGSRGRALRNYREAFRLDPSLSDPRHNPHVLDNSLATAAMLEAFSLLGPEVTSQHIYVEPTRITGLLLTPLTAAPDEPTDEPAMDEAEAEEPQEPELEEVLVEDPDG